MATFPPVHRTDPWKGTVEEFVEACKRADLNAECVLEAINRMSDLAQQDDVIKMWRSVDYLICYELGQWEEGRKWDDHGNPLNDATVAISGIWHWLDDLIKAWNRHCPQLYAKRAAEDARALWPQIAKVLA